MVGAKNIKDIILKDKLIFLHSILRLPDHAAPKQILLARLSSSSLRSLTNSMQHHLDVLNLPDIPTLVANTPSAGIWIRCIDRLIACHSQLNLLEEAESKRDLNPITQCYTKPAGAPAPHWKITHLADLPTPYNQI